MSKKRKVLRSFGSSPDPNYCVNILTNMSKLKEELLSNNKKQSECIDKISILKGKIRLYQDEIAEYDVYSDVTSLGNTACLKIRDEIKKHTKIICGEISDLLPPDENNETQIVNKAIEERIKKSVKDLELFLEESKKKLAGYAVVGTTWVAKLLKVNDPFFLCSALKYGGNIFVELSSVFGKGSINLKKRIIETYDEIARLEAEREKKRLEYGKSFKKLAKLREEFQAECFNKSFQNKFNLKDNCELLNQKLKKSEKSQSKILKEKLNLENLIYLNKKIRSPILEKHISFFSEKVEYISKLLNFYSQKPNYKKAYAFYKMMYDHASLLKNKATEEFQNNQKKQDIASAKAKKLKNKYNKKINNFEKIKKKISNNCVI